MMKHHTLSVLVITTTILVLTTSFPLKLTSETLLLIQNLRNSPVDSVTLELVDPFDFAQGSGPQEKFKDVSIPARRSVQRTLEVNSFASRSPFLMKLKFNDGTTASFHINMKYALGEGNAEFRFEAPFEMSFRKQGNTLVVVLGEK